MEASFCFNLFNFIASTFASCRVSISTSAEAEAEAEAKAEPVWHRLEPFALLPRSLARPLWSVSTGQLQMEALVVSSQSVAGTRSLGAARSKKCVVKFGKFPRLLSAQQRRNGNGRMRKEHSRLNVCLWRHPFSRAALSRPELALLPSALFCLFLPLSAPTESSAKAAPAANRGLNWHRHRHFSATLAASA